MNVAIFASAFYPSLGGVEELVRQLAHEYRRQGIQTIVLVNRWPRSMPAEDNFEGIPVYRLSMRMPEYNLRVRTNYALAYPFVRARMLRILRQHKIDLIHVQCVSANGHYASIASRALRIPLIVTSQGERTMDAERVYEKSPFMNTVLRRALAQADCITACSRDTLQDLERYTATTFGPRGSVIYNGIRLEDFQGVDPYSHPRPYILGIGRHVSQKGFDLLIQAFAASGLGSYDLLLAGDGPERKVLEQLAQKLLIEERVKFLGRADRATAVALFRGCEFFVLPSRQEPLGIVNLEAMAAGKAVIASKTGGVPEIVADGETGLLVPPGDAESLAGALRRIAGDRALRERLAAGGRERVRRFTWDAVAASYHQIYEAALAGRRSAPSGVAPAPVPLWNAE
jgi:glycosyltransferase involved in cell wall biosynthesis